MIQLAPAGAAELADLHALIEAAYRGERAWQGWTHEAGLIAGPRTSIGALAATLADPDELLLVARCEGMMIGCVQLSRRAPATAYLGLLTVDPARQAGGLGRAILAAAEEAAVAAFGAAVMQLSVVSLRTELIAYYGRRGYARTGEMRPFPIALEPPLMLAVMEKRIG